MLLLCFPLSRLGLSYGQGLSETISVLLKVPLVLTSANSIQVSGWVVERCLQVCKQSSPLATQPAKLSRLVMGDTNN